MSIRELVNPVVFYLLDTIHPVLECRPRRGLFAREGRWTGLFGSGSDPQAKQIFGQIAHTGSVDTFPASDVPKWIRHGAALFEIAPKLPLQFDRRRMFIPRSRCGFLNFLEPVLSLVHVGLQIVENHLFAAVEAHAGTVADRRGKTTAKPRHPVIAF
jgi:hypothetical protein